MIPGCFLHSLLILDAQTRENLRLWDVGCDEDGQGEQPLPQCLQCCLLQQAGAAGGHHYWVYHQVLSLVVDQPIHNDPDEGSGRYHPCFHSVRDDVRKDTVQLEGEKFWGALQYPPDARWCSAR